MTKFELFLLSEYLVETWLVGINKFKLNESAIIRRLSLMDELLQTQELRAVLEKEPCIGLHKRTQ